MPFKIVDSFPRMVILPDTKKTLEDYAIPSGCLLTVELAADIPHPLEFLQVTLLGQTLTLTEMLLSAKVCVNSNKISSV